MTHAFERFRLQPARRAVLVALLAICAAPLLASDPDNCLFCHQYRGLSRYEPSEDRVHLFFVQPEYWIAKLGPHARLACTDCHERSEVNVVPHHETTPVDCTRTCHLRNPLGVERRFSHSNIEAMLNQSVHTGDTLTELEFSNGSLLDPGQSNCLYCHDEPMFRDPTGAIPVLEELGTRAFDRCAACHDEQVPADISFYLRHVASRLQPARSTLEMAQVCAVCHSDQEVQEAHGLSNSVVSYMRSYHGKAALLGDEQTANCLSCHVLAGENAHLMLGPDEPGSAVHPMRVADSCRTTGCHPGADKSIASAAVHLDLPNLRGGLELTVAACFIVLTIVTFGPSLVLVVLELFAILIGRHSRRDARIERLTRAVLDHPQGRGRLTRFTVNQRVQHWVLAVFFVLLALTGFPLKFADQSWSRVVIDAFGGLSVARLVHHWAGLALMTGMVAHLVYAFWTLWRARSRSAAGGRRGLLAGLVSLPMWISLKDARGALHLLGYLLFLRRERPAFGRFNVKEKFEYLGVFWGTILLGLTGILLWGEQLVSQVLGGRVLNIALIAHTYEAFLAIIHVGILHIVNVVLSPNVFPLSPATLSGKTPVAELAESHAAMVENVARELGVNSGKEPGHG